MADQAGGTAADGTLIANIDFENGTAEAPQPAMEAPTQEAPAATEPEVQTQEPVTEPEPQPKVEPEAEKQKKLLIDMMEAKFKTSSQEELKQWFKENPSAGMVADKSKRLKAKYRELMDEDEIYEEPKADLTEIVAKTVEAQLNQKARDTKTLEFAVKRGIKDDKYKALRTNADGIQKMNPTFSWEDSLAAALKVVQPIKPTSVNIPGRTSTVSEAPQAKEQDMTEGIQIQI